VLALAAGVGAGIDGDDAAALETGTAKNTAVQIAKTGIIFIASSNTQ
jgi:hypothetical protein